MFISWNTYLLKFYELCGFYTPPNGSFGSLISILHTSAATFLSFYIVNFIVAVSALPVHKFIDVLNFLLHYISALLAYWAILFEMYKYRNVQKNFWTILNEINDTYCLQTTVISRNCFFIFFIHLLLFSTISIFGFFNGDSFPYDVKFVYFILLNHCDIRQTYFIIYFDLIKLQLEKIENELDRMIELNRIKYCGVAEDCIWSCTGYQQERLVWIRRYFELIYKMSECINTMFGCSELTIILLSFETLLAYANYAYRMFDEEFIINRSCEFDFKF